MSSCVWTRCKSCLGHYIVEEGHPSCPGSPIDGSNPTPSKFKGRRLLAIDPGLRTCGVAYFVGGTLAEAKLVVGPKSGDMAWNEMAGAVHASTPFADEVVIELPQVYNVRARSKGDANDLIQLAAVVGALATYHAGRKMQIVRPSQWKGQTKKEVTKNRCVEKLSEAELARVELPKAKSLHHNIFDAVGLGLWALKR